MTLSLVSMTPDFGAVAAAPAVVGGGALHAGYGASLGDVGAFDRALARAGQAGGMTLAPLGPLQPPGQAMQALFKPLEFINAEAVNLSAKASAAAEAGQSMTPGELLQLSVKCQEFMFHCQLTSNAANRTSDGLQQLFRQQA